MSAALTRLIEMLNASGEVDYMEKFGERHIVVTLLDGSRMLVVAEAIA